MEVLTGSGSFLDPSNCLDNDQNRKQNRGRALLGTSSLNSSSSGRPGQTVGLGDKGLRAVGLRSALAGDQTETSLHESLKICAYSPLLP